MAPRTVSAYYREAALAAEEGYSPETAYVERMEDAYEQQPDVDRAIYPHSTLAADPSHHSKNPSHPPSHLAYGQPLSSSSPMLRPSPRPAPLEMIDLTAANAPRVFALPPISPHRFEPYREPASPVYPDYATGERDHQEKLQPINSHSTSLFDWGNVDGAIGEKGTSRWWKSRRGIVGLCLLVALAVLAVGLGTGLAKREKGVEEAKIEGAADGASTASSSTSGLDATTASSAVSDIAETLSSLLETSATAEGEAWMTSRSISFGSEPTSTPYVEPSSSRAEDNSPAYTPPSSSYTPPWSSSYTPPRSSTSSSRQAAPTPSSSSTTSPPPPTSSPDPTPTSSPPAEPTSSAESVEESSFAEETSSSQDLLGLLNLRGLSTATSGNVTSHA